MPTPSRIAALALLWMTFGPSPARAQDELFHEGNRLYQAGDYAAALEAYRRVGEAGYESGPLHYNVGNTYFKLGSLGPAILHYERAARLMRGDLDVRANLELARSLTADDISPLPRFWLFDLVDAGLHLVPRTALPWIVAIAYQLLGLAALGLVLGRSPRLRRVARWGAISSGVVVALLGFNLAVLELGIGSTQEGIVMDVQVSAQSAPTDDPNLTVFTVHEGTKVRIDRSAEEWAEIVLEDGRVGWIRASTFETI